MEPQQARWNSEETIGCKPPQCHGVASPHSAHRRTSDGLQRFFKPNRHGDSAFLRKHKNLQISHQQKTFLTSAKNSKISICLAIKKPNQRLSSALTAKKYPSNANMSFKLHNTNMPKIEIFHEAEEE